VVQDRRRSGAKEVGGDIEGLKDALNQWLMVVVATEGEGRGRKTDGRNEVANPGLVLVHRFPGPRSGRNFPSSVEEMVGGSRVCVLENLQGYNWDIGIKLPGCFGGSGGVNRPRQASWCKPE